MSELLLRDKTAIVYGGGGAIGGAVAGVFAREGARVFLAGRTPASPEPRLDAGGDQAITVDTENMTVTAGGAAASRDAATATETA